LNSFVTNRWISIFGIFVLFSYTSENVAAFKWKVDEIYSLDRFSLSERYMYGSNHGPLGSKGTSTISIDFDVSVEAPVLAELNISVLFYTVNRLTEDDIQIDFCKGLPSTDGNSRFPKGPGSFGHGHTGDPKSGNLHLFQSLDGVRLQVDYPEAHSFVLKPVPGNYRRTFEGVTDGTNDGRTALFSARKQEGTMSNDLGITEEGLEYSNEYGLIQYEGSMEVTYKVRKTGLQYALFTVCNHDEVYYPPYTELQGNIDFKNTYGYLPAMYFGLLPWSGIRFALFLVFDTIFFTFFYLYRDKLLKVHLAVALVLFIATIEAASWFAAYENMNLTGQPFCCPFPASVITSMVFENLRKTVSRTLLLMICLGWGVSVPVLSRNRVIQVIVITLAYMVSGYLYEVTEIIAASRVKEGGLQSQEQLFTLPFLFCDIIFLTMIYYAIVGTMTNLRAANETFKLKIYQNLGKVLAVFVFLFTILTLTLFVCEMLGLYFPWQFIWVETASWDILNFAVLVAICILWRPSPRAHLLAISQQLPLNEQTVDDKDDDGMQMTSVRADSMIGQEDEQKQTESQQDQNGRNGDDILNPMVEDSNIIITEE